MKALRTSAKERVRLDAIRQVARSEVTVVAAAGASAAEALPIPRCRRAGASVACSPGNGRRAERPRERIVQRHQERYADLGPTLACEKLAEEGLTVSPDTLVALLRERHLWQRRRRRGRHGQRRERRASFGSLIQMDGAHHDRFEGRDPARVLRVPIDDAGGWTYAGSTLRRRRRRPSTCSAVVSALNTRPPLAPRRRVPAGTPPPVNRRRHCSQA